MAPSSGYESDPACDSPTETSSRIEARLRHRGAICPGFERTDQGRSRRRFACGSYVPTPLSGSISALSAIECGVTKPVAGKFLGTGPFRLHEESLPEAIRLVRNPFDPRPCALDEVHFRSFPLDREGKATALVEAVQEGSVDLTFDVPRQKVATLHGVKKWISPGLSTAILFLNFRRTKLGDARVRQAIAHGIDRYQATRSVSRILWPSWPTRS